MGNLDYARLAKQLDPYFAERINKSINAALAKAALPIVGSGGGGGIVPPGGGTDVHVLATDVALGTKHTVSGLTPGMVLRALSSTTAAFGVLQHGQLGGVGPNDHHNQSHAHNSADHTGLLAWATVDKTGSSLGDLATRNYLQLNSRTHDIIGGDHSYTGGAALDVFGLSAASTLAKLTPSDTVSSVQTALLKATNGTLTLDQVIATARLRSTLLDTASGSLTLSPAGTAVLPTGSILKDLGDYSRKWRSLFAAELYVENLVAQDVLATIGGRIMVAPTTKTISDTNSSQTTIEVEHNNITGAYIYMATAPGGMAQVEVMRVTAGPTTITGGYRYTVTRNIDGSGANGWVAGSAVANIGAAAGQGWIDLTSTNTVYNHLGPTMTIYSRTGMGAWTDARPTVSVGNLRSWVDYGSDEFGFALGQDLTLLPAAGFSGMTGDRVNGLRLFNAPIEMYASTVNTGKWYTDGSLVLAKFGVGDVPNRDFTFDAASGVLRIGKTGANKPNLYWTGSALQLRMDENAVIELAGDGKSYFQREIWLGSNGGIYQGTGSFASPTTGLKLWNDAGVGRLAGYNGGVFQAGFSSTGQIMAGGGVARMDAQGINVTAQAGPTYSTLGGYTIESAYGSGIVTMAMLYRTYGGTDYGRVGLGNGNTGSDAQVYFVQSGAANLVGLSAAGQWLQVSSGGLEVSGGATFGAAIDTTSGTYLELKNEGDSILRSLRTSAASYMRLGLGRTADGSSYFDLIGDTTYTAYGLRFIRNSGANGASQLAHRGTGVLQFTTQDAADIEFRTNNVERLRLKSDGLATFANSVRISGDYGSGATGILTLTNTSVAAGAGAGIIKLATAGSTNSAGTIKVWLGTQAVYIPYFTVS